MSSKLSQLFGLLLCRFVLQKCLRALLYLFRYQTLLYFARSHVSRCASASTELIASRGQSICMSKGHIVHINLRGPLFVLRLCRFMLQKRDHLELIWTIRGVRDVTGIWTSQKLKSHKRFFFFPAQTRSFWAHLDKRGRVDRKLNLAIIVNISETHEGRTNVFVPKT